jgi:hypothetical protein
MARSNGPQTPPGAGRTQRPDPQNWAQGTPPRQAAPRPAPQQSANAPYPSQPYGSQSYPAQAGPGPNAYPSQAGGASYQPQSAGAAYQQAAYGAAPASPQQPADSRQAPRGAEQWGATTQKPAGASAFDTLLAQEDPHKFGGGGFSAPRKPAYPGAATPSGAAYPAPAAPQSYGRPAAPADTGGFDHWSSNDQPGLDQSYSGGASQGFGQPEFGAAQQDYAAYEGGNGYADQWGSAEYGQHGHEPGFESEYTGQQDEHTNGLENSYAEDDYEDEPPRRSKLPLIAAAVVAALVCGGGLAYGYKAFLAPVKDGGTPLIKNASSPSKFKPDNPGGHQFPHRDNKIMGDPLSGEGPNASEQTVGGAMGSGPVPGASGPGGSGPGDAAARKVQTVEVRPDGSVVRSDSAPPQPSNQTTASIAADPPSGLGVGSDFPSAGDPVSGQASSGQASSGQASPPAAARAPAVISKPADPPAAAASEPAIDEPPPVATPKKVVAKKVAAADPAPSSSQSMSGPAPTGAGWVAVLASVPVSGSSQMDSLKQFADMQQKYGDVLGDKTPSVQEANLGDKGRYHRLVVGPPASRDSANTICGGLKTHGYTGCWVMQY